VFSFLCAAESASKAGNLFGYPAVGHILHRNKVKVKPLCDELSREGTSFVEEISHELRASLNDIEEILRMSEHTHKLSGEVSNLG
jgi:hypothetical protein